MHITIYLRIFCSYDQDNWFNLLPLAEFAYNDSLQEPTKMTPFFANYGYHPCFQSEIVVASEHAAPAAVDFASHLQEVQERLIENVKHAQDY